jgi:hypothetical protein
LNIKLLEISGPTRLPDGSLIATLTYEVSVDGATDPILVTFSVNPEQVDPEDAVEALREVADQFDDAIDAYSDFLAGQPNPEVNTAEPQFAGDLV